jgi:hypothetical protein
LNSQRQLGKQWRRLPQSPEESHELLNGKPGLDDDAPKSAEPDLPLVLR